MNKAVRGHYLSENGVRLRRVGHESFAGLNSLEQLDLRRMQLVLYRKLMLEVVGNTVRSWHAQESALCLCRSRLWHVLSCFF